MDAVDKSPFNNSNSLNPAPGQRIKSTLTLSFLLILSMFVFLGVTIQPAEQSKRLQRLHRQ